MHFNLGLRFTGGFELCSCSKAKYVSQCLGCVERLEYEVVNGCWTMAGITNKTTVEILVGTKSLCITRLSICFPLQRPAPNWAPRPENNAMEDDDEFVVVD